MRNTPKEEKGNRRHVKEDVQSNIWLWHPTTVHDAHYEKFFTIYISEGYEQVIRSIEVAV